MDRILNIFNSKHFIWAIFLMAFLLHLRGISESPNGFHTWREVDTATVAENYYKHDLPFSTPMVNMLGATEGIVGTEFPIYTYLVGKAYGLFGFDHAIPRVFSLIGFCFLLAGLGRLGVIFGLDLRAKNLLLYLTFCSPLMFFYSAKIQPDVWGMALCIWGVVFLISHMNEESWWHYLAALLCLTVAGGIKPTFLFVGLPLIYFGLNRYGPKFLTKFRYWAFALVLLGTIGIWFDHARGLNDLHGTQYFYLGGGVGEALKSAMTRKFFQNVLLTWPLEMVLFTPLVPFFFYGLTRKIPQHAPAIRLWVIGCAVIFVLAGGHCATPHDYYYLPMVPALLLLGVLGLKAGLESPKRWLRTSAILVLLLGPVFAMGRTRNRYNYDQPFEHARSLATQHIPEGQAILTVDKMPGYMMYLMGRQGERVGLTASTEDVLKKLDSGLEFLVVSSKHFRPDEILLSKLTQLARIDQLVTIYRYRPDKSVAAE